MQAWDGERKGKIIPAQVLPGLQGKGLYGKEAFLPTAFIRLLFVFIGAHYLATLGLGYFCGDKSNSPPAATERANVVDYNKTSLGPV